MTKQEAIVTIRTELVALYPDQEDMLRLAEDAELSIANIRLSDKAINSWRNILVEADKQHRIPRLIEVVSLEYEVSAALLRAVEAYRLAAEASRRRPGLGPSNERRQFTSLIDARIEATVDIRMPHILTGVVQMWELRTNPLLIWKVGSITGDKRRILLMSFIEGYTAKAIDTVRVEGSEVQTVPQLPTFSPRRTRISGSRHGLA